MLTDLDELVDYVRLTYGKEKVIIMAHSWGTFLGGIYSGAHPEKVSAYVSIGQMLDFKKSEQISAQEAIRLTNAQSEAEAALKISKKLELILGYQKVDKKNAMELMKFRQLKEKYLPSQYGNKMIYLYLFSPYMTFNDLKWMLSFGKLIESNSELYKALLLDSVSMYDYTLQYEAPLIIISGAHNWTTPHGMTLDYFSSVSTPFKKLITLENTGHIPFVDKPGEFSEALQNALCDIISAGGYYN